MADKNTIRKQISATKKSMPLTEISEKSELICKRFMEQEFYKNADVIYLYAPYNQEIITWSILEDAVRSGKRAAVPRCFGDVMEFFYITSKDELMPGAYGIPEPSGDMNMLVNEKDVLLLMPGLAFDKNMGRIGYGGGFYDKYLDSHKDTNFYKAALAYDFQLLDELPLEEHDYRVDALVTVSKVFS